MEQAQLEQLLQRKAVHKPSQQLQLIETHISWVLVADDYAYKIKKPVSFSFLDFSTLDQRRYYCAEEMRLNRRLAPDMYLDILPVRRTDDGPVIGGEQGELIDYALLMRRMDFEQQMDEKLRRDEVTTDHLAAIARQLAVFHKSAREITSPLDVQELKDNFNDLQVIGDFAAQYLGRSAVANLNRGIHFSNQFVEFYAERFRERAQRGFVIDGHGDLHSRNIFLLDQPVIFDCIEFNEDFRCLDVLSEIGFFLMDLDFFERSDLGNTFLHHYLADIDAMPHPADEDILQYFKLYRANVRYKVNGLQAMQAETEAQREQAMDSVRAYQYLFERYLKELQRRFQLKLALF